MRRILIQLVTLVPCALAFATGTRFYVIPTGSDASAGTSWGMAFQTFRHADSVAVSGDTIWVAAGTYTPAAVSSAGAYFKLNSGVAIYGGFAGTETALSQRSWQTNVTTLSGGGVSNTIVYSVSAGTTSLLDGFVITGGNSTTDGAGINLLASSPTLKNLTITGNITSANGGGLCNNFGHPTITNCSFIGNSANYGGGMYNYGGGVPVITDCIFHNNAASSFGGGFYNTDNTLAPQDILFDGNHATLGGGALFETTASSSTSSTFINLTLYGNTSKYGGAIFVSGSTSATIANSIVWNDTATTHGSEIYSTSGNTTTISYSIVSGGVQGSGLYAASTGTFSDGGHNLDLDPLFSDSSSGDFTLTSSSPAIDSGNNTVSTLSADLSGNARVSDGLVDIGAYEYQGAPLAVEMWSLAATAEDNNATVRWVTATETDNFGFDVERAALGGQVLTGSSTAPNLRSTPGNLQWQSVAFVKGVGSSNAPHEYSFTDNGLAPGLYSYRIRQIDRSGASTYSKEVHVEVGTGPGVFTLSQNYPNPFNPTTTIEFTVPTNGRVVLKVYDMLGRTVATLLDEDRTAGVNQRVVFDATRLASGVYFYRLQEGRFASTRKLILLK